MFWYTQITYKAVYDMEIFMSNSQSRRDLGFQWVFQVTLVLALGCLISCQAPMVGGQNALTNFQIKFLVQSQTANVPGNVQSGAGSRLLLPTAQTVKVAITPLATGLSEARSVSASISGGSAVVSIPNLIIGK